MRILKITILLLVLITSRSNATTEINYMVIQDQAQPFQSHLNKKHHTGIITDIVQEIFSGPDFDVKIHTLPFKRMIRMLEKGDIDNWITFGSPNWPGVQSANLSKLPVFNVQHSLLTSIQQDFDINSAKDIFGKTVILLHGFDYPGLDEHIAKKRIKAIKVKSYKSAFKVVNRLKGKAGFVEMDVRIKYNLKKEELSVNNYNLHDFSKVIDNYDLHLAMSPLFNKELQQHLEKSLGQLHQSGYLEKIIKAY